MIDIREDLLKIVKNILAEHVPECEVRAFGSRVNWTARSSSDLDLVVVGEEKINWKKMAKLKAAFEDSKIPFRVDVLDWNAVPKNFRENIGKKFEMLQSAETKKAISNGVREEAFLYDNNSWTAKPLGEVFSINPSRKIEKGCESAYIAMDQLSTGNRTISHVERRLFSGSGSKFKNGDTLLARITPCLENGKTAFVNCLEREEIAHGSTEFIVLSGKDKLSDNLFVYYFARSPEFRAYAISQMEGSSGRQRVPATTLEKYQINLPPIDTQRAIAHILGTLDDKIELNRRMNKTLEEIARAIYKSWFVDFDPMRKKAVGQPTGLPEEIEKLFPKEFEKSELGEIPKGWNSKPLGELLETVSITHDFHKSELVFLNTSDIYDGYVIKKSYGNVASFPGQAKKSIKCNDILFSEIRPANRRFAYVDFDAQDYVVSTKLMVLRAIGNVDPIALYYFVTGDEVLSELQMLAESRSGTFPQITFDQVKKIRMLVPSKEILREYSTFLSGNFDQCRILHSQNDYISHLRDELIPQLLSGSLPIRDAEKLLKEANV